MKLYHATYEAYLSSILKLGLKPGFTQNWSFSNPYIYFATDPDIAISFAESAEEAPEEYIDKIVVLEVDSENLDIDKLELDENITEDNDYSFQYKGIVNPELITVYSKHNGTAVRQKFDKALVAPYSDLGLAELINPIIEQYRQESDVDETRGQCYQEADNFVFWLQDNHPELFANLQDQGLNRIDGLFNIDYPEELPLELQDLEQDEYDEFMDQYENEIDFNDPEEVSECVWEYIQEHADEDRKADFYAFNHAWLDIDGFIIDFTWPQFENAISSTRDLIDRYEY